MLRSGPIGQGLARGSLYVNLADSLKPKYRPDPHRARILRGHVALQKKILAVAASQKYDQALVGFQCGAQEFGIVQQPG